MGNSKKIKLVIGITSFIIGGAQKLIIDQLSALDRERFEVYLITLFQFSKKKDFYNQLPSDIKLYKLNFRNFKDIKSWFNLFNTLRKIKPDIVVSHLFFCNTVFRLIKLFINYKVIIVEHNTYFYKTKFQIFVDKILSLITYKIIGVSKKVTNFVILQEKIKPTKFITIQNGINLDDINDAKKNYNKNKLKQELGFNENDKIIINVARLVPQKNHDLLIRAFAKFCMIKKDYKLIIIGAGSQEKNLELLINNLSLSDKVFLLGEKEKDEVYKYYKISDLFVSTSKIEGLSISYLEAIAFGLPLVATKTAGTDEIIIENENGYFLPENNLDIIVKILLRISEMDWYIMSEKAIKSSRNFDIKINVNKYQQVILDSIND